MTDEAAIDDAITAHFAAAGRTEVVTGWIALVSFSGIDEHGERSGIELVFSGGNMPWIPALGMVEAARLRLHADFNRGER